MLHFQVPNQTSKKRVFSAKRDSGFSSSSSQSDLQSSDGKKDSVNTLRHAANPNQITGFYRSRSEDAEDEGYSQIEQRRLKEFRDIYESRGILEGSNSSPRKSVEEYLLAEGLAGVMATKAVREDGSSKMSHSKRHRQSYENRSWSNSELKARYVNIFDNEMIQKYKYCKNIIGDFFPGTLISDNILFKHNLTSL